MAKIYDIVAAERYETRDGEKTKWNQVGKLIEKEDGKKFLTLHLFPGQTFQVFEQRPREERPRPQAPVQKHYEETAIEYPEDEEINPDDIPF